MVELAVVWVGGGWCRGGGQVAIIRGGKKRERGEEAEAGGG